MMDVSLKMGASVCVAVLAVAGVANGCSRTDAVQSHSSDATPPAPTGLPPLSDEEVTAVVESTKSVGPVVLEMDTGFRTLGEHPSHQAMLEHAEDAMNRANKLFDPVKAQRFLDERPDHPAAASVRLIKNGIAVRQLFLRFLAVNAAYDAKEERYKQRNPIPLDEMSAAMETMNEGLEALSADADALLPEIESDANRTLLKDLQTLIKNTLGTYRELQSRTAVLSETSVGAGAQLATEHAAVPGDASATTIRLAAFSPEGSSIGQTLAAWRRDLEGRTEGRVELHCLLGGSQGDDLAVIQKMRAGTLDAAVLTSAGLSAIAEPAVLLLSAPGTIVDRQQLGRAGTALSGPLATMFEEAGFVVLAWTWLGKNRIFSTKPFRTPSDLRRLRLWVRPEDRSLGAYLQAAGTVPVEGITIPLVYPELVKGGIDGFIGTSLSAVALQWYQRVGYVSKRSPSLSLAAIVLRKETFGMLSAEDRKTLSDTARRTAKAMDDAVEGADAHAYNFMLRQGLVEIDLSPTRAAWGDVASKARESLVGEAYSEEMLRAVERVSRDSNLRR